jgi:hypothetical protein
MELAGNNPAKVGHHYLAIVVEAEMRLAPDEPPGKSADSLTNSVPGSLAPASVMAVLQRSPQGRPVWG